MITPLAPQQSTYDECAADDAASRGSTLIQEARRRYAHFGAHTPQHHSRRMPVARSPMPAHAAYRRPPRRYALRRRRRRHCATLRGQRVTIYSLIIAYHTHAFQQKRTTDISATAITHW